MSQTTMIEELIAELETIWNALSKGMSDFERGQRDGIAWAMQLVEEIKEAPVTEPQCGD